MKIEVQSQPEGFGERLFARPRAVEGFVGRRFVEGIQLGGFSGMEVLRDDVATVGKRSHFFDIDAERVSGAECDERYGAAVGNTERQNLVDQRRFPVRARAKPERASVAFEGGCEQHAQAGMRRNETTTVVRPVKTVETLTLRLIEEIDEPRERFVDRSDRNSPATNGARRRGRQVRRRFGPEVHCTSRSSIAALM